MIDGSFKGFTPPPHSSPFTQQQSEFEFASRPARTPVVLETFPLPVQFFEIKKACDEYAKKGSIAKFFGAPGAIAKIIEYNNQVNDRILTLNRNTMKIHSSLEDLATDFDLVQKNFETVQKELSEKKKDKETPINNDNQYLDRISSLEAEQRHLKLMINNMKDTSGSSNLIFWAIGLLVVNVLVTYGIVNSLN